MYQIALPKINLRLLLEQLNRNNRPALAES